MILTHPEVERLDADAHQLLAAYEKGQYTSLLAEVDELSKRGPLSAGVLGLAAASLIALERFEEAATVARAAAERQPRWAWLHLALSRGEGGRGDWTRATEAARQAVQLLPEEPAYLANLAGCQRESGQPDLAVKTARQALQLVPDHPESLNQLGLALEALGDESGALEQFLRAQAQPGETAAYLHAGALHHRAGRVSEARRAYQEALRREPGLTEAEDRLAESLTRQPLARRAIMHLLAIARLSLIGWTVVAFFYYLLFRLLQFFWRTWEGLLPVGQTLLVVSLIWILGGALAGLLIRALLRYRRW